MAQLNSLPALPSEAEVTLAKEMSRVLASRKQSASPLQLRLVDESDKNNTLQLPAPAVDMLVRILEEMARGNAVSLIPVQTELTTQEAADLLQISRPSLIQLLEDGQIPFRRVGTHRRVRFADLLSFKRRADAERRAVLAELAAYDQELGI
jgi:excisionase family DNA binding protein